MRRLLNILKNQSWAPVLGLALLAGLMAMTSGCEETTTDGVLVYDAGWDLWYYFY